MFLTFPLIVHKNQESMGFTIDDYYNPSWQIYHQWRRLYIASDATAKNLRALDFAQKKKNKDKEYTTVSIFQIQSPPLRLHAWNKRRLERFLSLWKGKCIVAVAVYSNHQVPSSRSVRLVRLSRVEEWRPMLTNSPRHCYLRLFISPLLVSPVGLCPLYFHADDSCRPAFVMHDTMHFYFHFATQDLAPLSMIRSSKVIQYSRNVAAQRSRSIVLLKYYSSFLPLLPMKDASMGGKRGSGIFSPSFLFFSFVLLRWIDFFRGTARPCFFFFATNS